MDTIITRQTARGLLTIGLDQHGHFVVHLDGRSPAGLFSTGIVSLAADAQGQMRQLRDSLLAAGYSHSIKGRVGLYADEAARLQAAMAAHPMHVIEDYERVCAAIPGLRELDAAHQQVTAWRRAYNRAMDDEMASANPPAAPKIELAQSPRAQAFRRARAESRRVTSEYAAAGRRAMWRLVCGDDPAAVLTEMDAEIHAATDLWR